MFEQAGCSWCEAFDREIAPIYHKTAEGQRAPLRRVDIDQPVPQDLAFIAVERLAKGESGVMVGLQAREIVANDLAVVSARKRETDLEFYRMARMLAK